MDTAFDYTIIDAAATAHEKKPSAIIAILQEIQEHYRYIPREAFPRLAAALGISEARIYSVATFYENFSLEPKGKYVIKVCDGTACHVRKSIPILERLRADLRSRRRRTSCSRWRQCPASAPAASRPSSRSMRKPTPP